MVPAHCIHEILHEWVVQSLLLAQLGQILTFICVTTRRMAASKARLRLEDSSMKGCSAACANDFLAGLFAALDFVLLSGRTNRQYRSSSAWTPIAARRGVVLP